MIDDSYNRGQSVNSICFVCHNILKMCFSFQLVLPGNLLGKIYCYVIALVCLFAVTMLI